MGKEFIVVVSEEPGTLCGLCRQTLEPQGLPDYFGAKVRYIAGPSSGGDEKVALCGVHLDDFLRTA